MLPLQTKAGIAIIPNLLEFVVKIAVPAYFNAHTPFDENCNNFVLIFLSVFQK